MPKFRKKPVVIEAEQFQGDAVPTMLIHPNLPDTTVGGVTAYHTDNPNEPIRIEIRTLEGVMILKRNAWVIKGVNGELYPCDPDIFEKTYDPVDDD